MKGGPVRASLSKSQAGRIKTATIHISSGKTSVTSEVSVKTK